MPGRSTISSRPAMSYMALSVQECEAVEEGGSVLTTCTRKSSYIPSTGPLNRPAASNDRPWAISVATFCFLLLRPRTRLPNAHTVRSPATAANGASDSVALPPPSLRSLLSAPAVVIGSLFSVATQLASSVIDAHSSVVCDHRTSDAPSGVLTAAPRNQDMAWLDCNAHKEFSSYHAHCGNAVQLCC